MNTYKYDIYVGAYLDKLDKFGVNGDWVIGDWLIHWPSTTLQDRLELFDYYQSHIVK
jgi:hypothetical protein